MTDIGVLFLAWFAFVGGAATAYVLTHPRYVRLRRRSRTLAMVLRASMREGAEPPSWQDYSSALEGLEDELGVRS